MMAEVERERGGKGRFIEGESEGRRGTRGRASSRDACWVACLGGDVACATLRTCIHGCRHCGHGNFDCFFKCSIAFHISRVLCQNNP